MTIEQARTRPVLSAGFASLALRIQEMATAMSHDDIRTRLRSAIQKAYEGTGNWCYVMAVFGDDISGDVVYECSNELMRAPYTCSPTGASVDTTKAVGVIPITTYEVATGFTEAGRRNSSRDLKQLQSIHDAALTLGAACPVAEAHRQAGGSLVLVESAATLEPIVLREARSDYEIKLIAPGKGSSAFYPREVLQRDGPKVFKANTHVYLNHPTAAEEAARPEGDVANLAGVLTTDAVYHESHAKGEGLYARMKVFADHATLVEEKAPHVGMSIRAGGIAESGKTREGLPVLKELTRAESVDVVTRAGAGGLILTEAAVPPIPIQEDSGMDAAEFAKLKESLAAREANEKILMEAKLAADLRAARSDARDFTVRTLKGITLHEAGKELVLESVMRGEIPQKDGVVDETKLKEAIDAEAKRVGAAIAAATGSGQVRGMGTGGAPVVPIDAKEAEAQVAREKSAKELRFREVAAAYHNIGMPEEAAKRAASRGYEEVA